MRARQEAGPIREVSEVNYNEFADLRIAMLKRHAEETAAMQRAHRNEEERLVQQYTQSRRDEVPRQEEVQDRE